MTWLLFAVIAVARSEDHTSPSDADPVTAVQSGARLTALKQYQLRHMVRAPLGMVSSGFVPIFAGTTMVSGVPYTASLQTWTVYDGGGATFKAGAFAERVQDTATLERFAKVRHTRLVMGIALSAVGAAVATGSAVAIANTPRYWSQGSYTPLLCFGAGLVTLEMGVLLPLRRPERQMISKAYEPEEADRWVASYNGALRGELGLTELDTAAIDLGTSSRSAN
jgi:hypothetical protein